MEVRVRTLEAVPPAGWVSLDGSLTPGMGVTHYAARGQNVRGSCAGRANDDCKRTVTIDAARLCSQGLGALGMDRIKRTYRCQRLDDCMLTFHDLEPDLPLTLSRLTGRAYVRIRLTCRGCKLRRLFTAEEVVARLRAANKGDSGTRLDGLGGKISGACPNAACGKRNWQADVLWANVDTAGWRALGERVFDQTG